MSLLMPEYERQLKAAARRLAGGPAAPKRPPGRLGSWLLVGAAVAVTLAVAATAIVLIAHGRSVGERTAGAGRPAVQYDCAPHQIPRAKGRLVPVAHGTVAGKRWTLETDTARRGLQSVQAGRLLLGGRSYGFCDVKPDGGLAVEVELVNAGRYGIVYGIAANPDRPPIRIQATTRAGSKSLPLAAPQYRATTRQVPGATFFLRALPASACTYRFLSMTASQLPTTSTTRSGLTSYSSGEVVVLPIPLTRSCAPGQLRQTAPTNPHHKSPHRSRA